MSTYSPIASQTVASATTSITFDNIPQNFTDLVLVFKGSGSSGSTLTYQFNNDASSIYSDTYIYADGSAGSGRHTNQGVIFGAGINTSQSTQVIQFMNYANSTTFKTTLLRGTANGTGASVGFVGLWRSTSSIYSIKLSLSSNFASGSTFDLYGITTSDISTGKATGGNRIIKDSTYWYHVFTTSGTFTPTQAITADILQIAGGGGGGGYVGGGGGAGGLLAYSSQSLTTTSYAITVGAGGSGGTQYTKGSSGGNSQFGALTASVGGGGGGSNNSPTNTNGVAGGSGGGAGGTGGPGTGGAGTAGQGNNGGNNSTSGPEYGSGGGGGAGAVGSNGTSSSGGAGGAGTNSYSSWAIATNTGVSGFYAGGGGGGSYTTTGGAGGSGGGSQATAPATNAITSTGSGGGGFNNLGNRPGGNGGSGIVIIRYAI